MSSFVCEHLAEDPSDSESNGGNTLDNVRLFCRLATVQVSPDYTEDAQKLFTGRFHLSAWEGCYKCSCTSSLFSYSEFCDGAGGRLTARVVGFDHCVVDKETYGSAVLSVYLYDTSADDAEDMMMSINDILCSSHVAWSVPEPEEVTDMFNQTQNNLGT